MQFTIHESSPALFGRATEFNSLAEQLKDDVEQLRRVEFPKNTQQGRSVHRCPLSSEVLDATTLDNGSA
jgi:hypothetical protein